MIEEKKPKKIQLIFNSIAPIYDWMNWCMSFGIHTFWNRKMVQTLISNIPAESHSVQFLDLCCGTGAISFLYDAMMEKKKPFLKRSIIGIDFSSSMLDRARETAKKKRGTYTFLEADVTKTEIKDESADHIGIAYGIRNIQNREKLFSELFRILKANRHLVILELTRPSSRLVHFFHANYLRFVIPFIGMCVGKKTSYEYLASSIGEFIPREIVLKELTRAGFSRVSAKPLSFGIATLFIAYK